MKTIRMKFITELQQPQEDGGSLLPGAGAEGAAKVKAAADLILEQQPFDVTLVSCESAELIERTSTEIELTEAGA